MLSYKDIVPMMQNHSHKCFVCHFGSSSVCKHVRFQHLFCLLMLTKNCA
jgi:hypothetical protein